MTDPARECSSCGYTEQDSAALVCPECGDPLPAPASSLLDELFPAGGQGLPPADAVAPGGGAEDFTISSDPFDAPTSYGSNPLPPTRTPAAPTPGSESGWQESNPVAPPDATASPNTGPAHPGGGVPRRLRLSNPGLEIEITPGVGVALGRAPSSPISGHPSVSSHTSSNHARVWIDVADPDTVYVADSGSTNGTWLQGDKLEPHVPNLLNVGDIIRLARANPVFLEVLP